MKLDERTKERINNYFNGISSEQAYEIAIKYNIVEAIEWGKPKGQTLPIDSVVGQSEQFFAFTDWYFKKDKEIAKALRPEFEYWLKNKGK